MNGQRSSQCYSSKKLKMEPKLKKKLNYGAKHKTDCAYILTENKRLNHIH